MKPVIGVLAPLAIAVALPQCSAPLAGRPYDKKMEQTHTMYRKLTCNLMVEDVNQTIRFYRDVLEFAFVIGIPENSQTIVSEADPARPLAFAIMQHGDVQVMFQSRASLTADLPISADRPVGGSIVLYIETTDAKPLYEKLRGKVNVLSDLHDTFYGKREFYIKDCNGYVLGFAGDLPPQEVSGAKANP
jgi:uncharacterized glyoxalase superfamily protein PhnB